MNNLISIGILKAVVMISPTPGLGHHLKTAIANSFAFLGKGGAFLCCHLFWLLEFLEWDLVM